MANPPRTILEIARAYLARGWAPVPILFREKRPVDDGWPSMRLTDADLVTHFSRPSNIGIILGEPSGWLVDVDLDCDETVALAATLFPSACAFGRASKRRSHLLFVAPGAKTQRFIDPITGKTLVEFRSTGGQTVFPGSTHKDTGETIEWEPGPTIPAAADAVGLRQQVARLAVAALYQRHAPDALDTFLAFGDIDDLPEQARGRASEWMGLTPPAAPAPPPVVRNGAAASRFDEASDRYNADHARDWGKPGHGHCPACRCPDDGCKCFGRLKGSDDKWACFNTDHPAACGRRGPSDQCYIGDALDLDSYLAGCGAAEHLRNHGYLESRPASSPPPDPPPPDDADAPPDFEPSILTTVQTPTPPPPILSLVPAAAAPLTTTADALREPGADDDTPTTTDSDGSTARVIILPATSPRGLTLRSYATLCQVLRTPACTTRFFGDRRLEFNEMLQTPVLGRALLSDAEYAAIREAIEINLAGLPDSGKGQPQPLRYSPADIFQAVDQVAREHPFHPVEEYLRGLRWDGVKRLNSSCGDWLPVDPSLLNIAMVRAWFISAVARALDPGCKVDTLLILVGPQGYRKSEALRALAGDEWFSDTAIDLSTKDAYMALQRVWILEWSELEAIKRARDANAVKSFLSSRVDGPFRPPYGRAMVTLKRRCVICGSSNEQEFLGDATGNRRYWILTIQDHINLRRIAELRDQLWAEAVAAYGDGNHDNVHGEAWFLPDDLEQQLAATRERHEQRDAWEDTILDFAKRQRDVFTTATILGEELKKPPGQWTRADEMRVAAVLRHAGYDRDRITRLTDHHRVWAWLPRPTTPT